jgi:hypothetical protein
MTQANRPRAGAGAAPRCLRRFVSAAGGAVECDVQTAVKIAARPITRQAAFSAKSPTTFEFLPQPEHQVTDLMRDALLDAD